MNYLSIGRFRPGKVLVVAMVGLCLAIANATIVSTLQAQQERPTSLDIVPASATFYMASMNHQAQYNAVVESNAYQQLMDCEVAKRMRKAYRSGRRKGFGQFGWGNPFGQYLESYSQSIGSVPGKMVMNYLSDIFGNEVFVYGDQDWIEMSKALANFYKDAGQTMENVDLNDIDDMTINKLLELGRTHLAGVNTPKLVIGTVLDSPGGTKSLLQMAELGIDEVLTQIPDEMDYLIDGYEVIEEDDLYLLTFQMNSEMMPWDELEGDPDLGRYLDDIKAILSDKTINISIGVKGQFLLLSVGPDNQHIKSLGSGDLLVDLPKLAPLRTASANHPITGVRYKSEQMARFNHESIPGLVDTAMAFGKTAFQSVPRDERANLDGLMEDLESDVEEFKSDLMANLPEPGAYLGFSYLFEGGIEGYMFDWTENKYLNDSKPLSILDHVGQRPAMFVAGRSGNDQGQYKLARKWMARVYDRVMKYAPDAAPNEREAELLVDIGSELRDILSEVADSTGDNLLAATEGKQTAMVLDFTTAKESWHDEMPQSYSELPIPSISFLIEHHDKEKVLAAGSSYLQAAVDISEMIRDIPNSDMPDEFQIRDPLKKSAFGGDLYYYELPIQAGLDESLAPHALIRDDLVLLGYSLDQTNRLLEKKSPPLKGLLADRSKNLMAASYYNNREVVKALYVWAKYGLSIAKSEGAEIEFDQDVENDLLAFEEPELMNAVDHLVTLLKCFESSSSMSYMEDGAQVTRYQMLFKDVPED